MAGHLMRFYQRSGVQRLVRKSRMLGLLPGRSRRDGSADAGYGRAGFSGRAARCFPRKVKGA